MKIDLSLLNKHNTGVPRYTSYPTVPYWKEGLDVARWKALFDEEFSASNSREGISLYIHLPFCDSLCTYCGCTKKITTNHSVEKEYIDSVIKEWKMYRKLMSEPPIIREVHLGGGTPTFFSPRNLNLMLGEIYERSIVHPHHEFSIEGHPNNTTRKHLEVLYAAGFRRISYGVQDNDPDVQHIINRVQPFSNLKVATEEARSIGFTSVNFDLIYGLPKQTPESITRTIRQVLELIPDRLAFYSYAHMPWTNRGQRLFDETDLPSAEEKLNLYITGKKLFNEAGYKDIGMDHFALHTDQLYSAWLDGNLHRNFMGYTTHRTTLLLGLGVSSISETTSAFAQNKKTLHEYYEAIDKNDLAIFRGHFLDEEDRAFRQYILDISCRGTTNFKADHLATLEKYCFPELTKLQEDGLVEWNKKEVVVTGLGKHFLRNICRAFDLHLLRNQQKNEHSFSKSI